MKPFLANALTKGCAIILSLLFLAACTTEYRAMAVAAADAAATQADFNARAKQWAWCNTLTSGAEKRLYGGKKKIWQARMAICWPDLALDKLE